METSGRDLQPELDVLDRGALEEQLQDRQLIVDVLTLFRKETSSVQTELVQLVAANDGAQLARVAHRLKGSLHALFARRALQAASALEALAKEGAYDELPAGLQKLEDELARLDHQIEPLLAELRAKLAQG